MLIFWTLVVGALLGYVFGHYIKPNLRLRESIREAKRLGNAVIESENMGVYRTIVTDKGQTSELTVEVKEIAVTSAGQVKVEYMSAFYKNPDFRNKKGEALMREVRDLLGDYLPVNDIEWYETADRHENAKKNLRSLDTLHRQHFGE